MFDPDVVWVKRFIRGLFVRYNKDGFYLIFRKAIFTRFHCVDLRKPIGCIYPKIIPSPLLKSYKKL